MQAVNRKSESKHGAKSQKRQKVHCAVKPSSCMRREREGGGKRIPAPEKRQRQPAGLGHTHTPKTRNQSIGLDEAKNGPASPSFPLRRRSKKEVSSVPRVFQNAKVALHMCVYRSMQYMQDLRSPGLVNQMAGGEGGVEREKKKNR
jgi:hypothetical protein